MNRAFLNIGLVFAVGCSGGVSDATNGVDAPDSSVDPRVDAGGIGHRDSASAACVAGETVSCACPAGASGVRVCSLEGAYGACACGGVVASPDGGGGVTPVTGTDAGADVGAHAGADADFDADFDSGSDAAPPLPSCTLPDAGGGSGAGSLGWAKDVSVAATESYTTGIATDPSTGDVVVVGYEQVLTSDPAYNLTVAKYDSSGNSKWSQTFDGEYESGPVPGGVAIDGAGNIVIGVFIGGIFSFGGSILGTEVNGTSGALLELDSAGNPTWSKAFTSDALQGTPVVVDGAGDIFMGGGMVGGVALTKLDSTGTEVWTVAVSDGIGGTTPLVGTSAIAIDLEGNVIIAGTMDTYATTYGLDFGGGVINTNDDDNGDAFVAKYDSSGHYLWATSFSTSVQSDSMVTGTSIGGGLGVDACGDILVAGNFFPSVNLGTGWLSAPDSSMQNLFLAKLDANGNGIWAKQFNVLSEGNGELSEPILAVDGAGRPSFTVGIAGTVDFGGGKLTGIGADVATAAIASFDASGGYRWSFAEEAPSTAAALSTAMTITGSSLVVAGTFGPCVGEDCTGMPTGDTFVLPGVTLTATTTSDVFVASFAP